MMVSYPLSSASTLSPLFCSNSLALLLLGNLDHSSGDDGPSEGSSQEVDSLINGVTLDGG
jgi:hypothetical protein